LDQAFWSFLLFSNKLVQFSTDFFDLDANFFSIQPFLDFSEGLLDLRVFSSGKLALLLFGKKASYF
jgi:hypothetical protein